MSEKISIHESLQLCPISEVSCETLLRLIEDNREHLRQHLGWIDKTQTIDQMASFITLQTRAMEAQKSFTYGILYKEEIAGIITLRDLPSGNPSIGYWLAKSAQSQGLVTSSCKAIIDIASQIPSISEITLYAGTTNQRSIAVAERLGFSFIGIKKDHETVRGKSIDVQHFSMKLVKTT